MGAGYFSESFTALFEFSPYVAIFFLLTAGIWLIPFAEEIALITAGYLYYSNEVPLVTILPIAGVGVFLGDFLAFWLGQHWNLVGSHRALTYLSSSQWLTLE